jgi:hypothetical protein
MTSPAKQPLAWFGFGSLAVIALATPANANTTPLRELVFTAPDAIADAPTEVLDCTCSQDTSDAFADDEVDVEGELAIENLGCDCAGCRNIVRSMLEASTLRPSELR